MNSLKEKKRKEKEEEEKEKRKEREREGEELVYLNWKMGHACFFTQSSQGIK